MQSGLVIGYLEGGVYLLLLINLFTNLRGCFLPREFICRAAIPTIRSCAGYSARFLPNLFSSEIAARMLHPFYIRVAHRPSSYIKTTVSHPKDKLDKVDKTGVSALSVLVSSAATLGNSPHPFLSTIITIFLYAIFSGSTQ